MLNFNLPKREYDLNTHLIDELINLYGTEVKILMNDKITDFGTHEDLIPQNMVFQNFKALKSSGYEFPVRILIQETDGFPNGMHLAFGQFGIMNEDTLQAIISKKSLKFLEENGTIHPKHLISNSIVFPNGKVMEITNCQIHVPGMNNGFVLSNIASCYMLSLKSAHMDATPVLANPEIYDTLDNEVIHKSLIREEAEASVLTSVDNEEIITNRSKIDDVFGLS